MTTFLLCWYALGWVMVAIIALHDDQIEFTIFLSALFLWPLCAALIIFGLICTNPVIWRKP